MKMKKVIRMPLRRGPAAAKPALPSRKRQPSLRARAATVDDYDEDDYEAEEEPNMKLSHAFFVVLILHVIAVGGVFAFNSIKASQSDSAKTASTGTPEAFSETSAERTTAAAQTAAPAAPAAAAPAQPSGGRTHTVQPGETLTRIAAQYKTTIEAIEQENGITDFALLRVGQVLKIPAEGAAPAVRPKTSPDSAKTASAPAPAAKTTAPAKPVETAAPAAANAKAADAQPKAAGASVTDDGIYVVVKGDNPYSIAKKLQVSYSALIEANDIKDPTKIQIGQKLKIPTK